jgi:hypothetical protein
VARCWWCSDRGSVRRAVRARHPPERGHAAPDTTHRGGRPRAGDRMPLPETLLGMRVCCPYHAAMGEVRGGDGTWKPRGRAGRGHVAHGAPPTIVALKPFLDNVSLSFAAARELLLAAGCCCCSSCVAGRSAAGVRAEPRGIRPRLRVPVCGARLWGAGRVLGGHRCGERVCGLRADGLDRLRWGAYGVGGLAEGVPSGCTGSGACLTSSGGGEGRHACLH